MFWFGLESMIDSSTWLSTRWSNSAGRRSVACVNTAQERRFPISEISDVTMRSMLESEVRSVHEQSPFQNTREIHDKMMRALSMMPNASIEAGELRGPALTKWSTGTSLATAIVKNDLKKADLSDATERIVSLRAVFSKRTYWSRL